MNADEIKQAINQGKTVCWSHTGYEVRKIGDQYLIVCLSNQHAIGLTWLDGITLNGEPEDFFIKPEELTS